MMDGQTSVEDMLASENPALRNAAEQALKKTAAIRAQMSGEGELGLPPLLEDRRWEYGIIDGFFAAQPCWDRVHIYQIPQFKSKTYDPSGVIVMPDSAVQRETHQCPEGIIVAAGLSALDALRSHGMDLGHRVIFIRNAPWRVRVGMVLGQAENMLPMTVGDIGASYDTTTELRSRRARVKYNAEKQQHMLIDADGKEWAPTVPWKEGDY